jgi:hypothetical protein
MTWGKVGEWIKGNAGSGVALVGSLLTGNLPGAIAAGVSMVSSATGSDDPATALSMLQSDPASMLKLKELYYQEQENVRKHLQEMTRLGLEDKQKQHTETQTTVRAGDTSGDRFVRWTRPGQAWCSLFAAFVYVFTAPTVDVYILAALLTLSFSYAGLRQIGKGVDVISSMKVAQAGAK